MALSLPDGKWDIVYVDPPWRYHTSHHTNRAENHYPTMAEDEIAAMPIRSILSKTSAVFMWATAPKLDSAIRVLSAWGLNYRGVAYVWIKTRKDGAPIGAAGVAPTFVKPTTEFVLVATAKDHGRPFPILTLKQRQLVFAPRTRHSEKPEEVRRRIEELCGDRPRIELFARKPSPGWAVWGNEV